MQHKRKLKRETHGELECYRAGGCRCRSCASAGRAARTRYLERSYQGPVLTEQMANPPEKMFPCGFNPNTVSLSVYAEHIRTCPDPYCQHRAATYESVKRYFIQKYGRREAVA